MTLAADARDAARAHPFVHAGLRAGVINHTAAARFLGADDDEVEAVAAALRRYAAELSEPAPPGDANARVDMRDGLGVVDDSGDEADAGPDTGSETAVADRNRTDAATRDPLFAVGDVALAPGAGDLTGLLARGEIGPQTLAAVLGRLEAEGVAVTAAGAADGWLLVAVPRADGIDALRYVEDAIDPTREA